MRRRMPETFAERLRVIPLVCSPAPSRHTASSAGSVPEDAQQTVVMTGNLGYFPNQEGASWFLREVWPQLRSARSEVRLLLAGTRPTGALVRLAARHDVGLRASPRRLVAALEIADVAVAPIFSGAGIPVKVLEAWAHRVPVVASRWAADGAGASDGVDVLCAGSPSEWVSAILRLLDDRTLQQDLSRAGVERLRQWHSAERLNRELGEWIVAPSLTGHKDD